ncbi:MAG TPA: Fic family protein [Candidatus Saccharimonadales bacterium]|nr:Fic family protein [Candidatus Saccharimonadales bacterium]
MRLNKSTSYVLLYLLVGGKKGSGISKLMPGVDIRSIQRALTRLVELRIVNRSGPRNNPSYSVSYDKLLVTEIPTRLLEDENRPETRFNHGLVNWLNSKQNDLDKIIATPNNLASKKRMTAKELEYLTIELSWKSSALEGNTYTLLDTQLLLTEGIKAKNRTEFETQMILNHKEVIKFIIENPELFNNKIRFSTVEELHKLIAFNLGIEKGLRKKLVKISASNYVPLANPHQLREYADVVLDIINKPLNPVTRSLFVLTLIPYLQLFEDGNKRTGRMLANAILISSIGRGFSLRKVSAKELALAYLAFYEFNSMSALSRILDSEINT